MNDLRMQVLKTVVKHYPGVLPHLTPQTLAALKAGGGYDGIRYLMHAAVYDAVEGYLSGTGYAVTYQAAMATAISQAYIETADIAYEEGGGTLPLDDETAAWARSMLDAQLAYVDQLFETLRELRKEGDVDAAAEAGARADGYASSLDQLYSEALTRGAKNKMLTFVGDDGKESCKDCKRMKGQRHRASWWIDHDMVPGSSSYECGGWNCAHYLQDDDGNQFTI